MYEFMYINLMQLSRFTYHTIDDNTKVVDKIFTIKEIV